jgi:hypothetical protein
MFQKEKRIYAATRIAYLRLSQNQGTRVCCLAVFRADYPLAVYWMLYRPLEAAQPQMQLVLKKR